MQPSLGPSQYFDMPSYVTQIIYLIYNFELDKNSINHKSVVKLKILYYHKLQTRTHILINQLQVSR